MASEVAAPASAEVAIRRINDEHRLATGAIKNALEHAINCGNLLLDAQSRIPTGWTGWLRENFEGGERTAQRYMQLAHHYNQNPNAVADIGSHYPSTISAAAASIARKVEGPGLTLEEPTRVVKYALTLEQLVELARQPEELVLATLHNWGLA